MFLDDEYQIKKSFIQQFFIIQFAAAKAGLVLVNINPAYQANELKYALNKVCKSAYHFNIRTYSPGASWNVTGM